MNGGTIRSIFQLAYPSEAAELEPSTTAVEAVVIDQIERPQAP